MPTLLQTSQQFAFNGAFAPAVLTAAGIALAVVIALLAWRESRMTRRWLLVPLWTLRMVAGAVVLWMLAGPAILTTIRHTHSKSIAIVVDRSGSMNAIDPADDPGTARWAAALSKETSSTKHLDEAATLLSIAAADLLRAQSATSSHMRATLLSQARRSRDAAVERLKAEEADTTIAPAIDSLGEGKTDLSPLIHSLQDAAAKAAQLAEARATSPVTSASSARLTQVSALLETSQQNWLREIEEKSKVLRFAFDSSAVPLASSQWQQNLSIEPNAPSAGSTDVAAALEAALRDGTTQPLEAIVLLTDGGHNAVDRDPVKIAAASGTPIFVVPIGRQNPERDIFVHHVQGPRTVFKDAQIVIDATVDAHGYPNQSLHAELLAGEQVLDRQDFTATSDTFVHRLRFKASADALGRREYTLRVTPLPDERVADNNGGKLAVDVIEDKMPILLADALPRWEYRYLRNLFRRDEHVVFDDLLVGHGDSIGARSLPRDLESLAKYRIVILGDLSPEQIAADQQEMLEQYVGTRGGTLVIIAGDAAMPAAFAGQPLEKLIPVTRESIPDSAARAFDLLVTPEGRNTPAVQIDSDPLASERIWREISTDVPFYGLSEYSRAKPQAHVLISAALRPAAAESSPTERAFLSWQYYGSGRVVFLSAPYSYRLRQRYGDRYHYQFWGQLLQWAVSRDLTSGPKTVRLSTDKTRYASNEDVAITLQLSRVDGSALSGAKPRVTAAQDQKLFATTPLVEDQSIPGMYRGMVRNAPPGPVVLEAAGSEVDELLRDEGHAEAVTTTVAVDPPDSPELRDTRCNLALLKQLAEVSHGAVVPPDALAAAMSTLDLSPQIDESVSQRPLWTKWWLLWVFIGCLGTEWTLRKLNGLA